MLWTVGESDGGRLSAGRAEAPDAPASVAESAARPAAAPDVIEIMDTQEEAAMAWKGGTPTMCAFSCA